DQRDIQILKFLSEDPLSSDLIVSNVLTRHPEFIFDNKFINEKFQGKTFAELSETLDGDIKLDNEFKKEIIEQVIAYLTKPI
ncbi:MAG: hypothetical protein ABJQ86_00455, partial [Cyclobacteriaceae bacterium]